MQIKPFLLLTLSLAYLAISQTQVYAQTYEWIDDNGVTNYGDSVPEKYQHKANPVEIKPNVIPAPVLPSPAPKTDNNASNQTDPTEQLKPIVLEVPMPKDLSEEGCDAQVKQYKESQNCFARYRNARGAISEEGVIRCAVIQQPACDTTR